MAEARHLHGTPGVSRRQCPRFLPVGPAKGLRHQYLRIFFISAIAAAAFRGPLLDSGWFCGAGAVLIVAQRFLAVLLVFLPSNKKSRRPRWSRAPGTCLYFSSAYSVDSFSTAKM